MDDDDNGRLGMWIAIGAALLVALGTVLTLVWSTLDDETSAGGAQGARASTSTSAATTKPGSGSAPAVTAATAAAAAPVVAAAAPSAPAPVTATPATAAADADNTVDLPLSGDLLGKVYFEVGKAGFTADGAATIDKAVGAVGSGTRKVVLSGFHDLSGNAAQNAELAKNRAKAVREALKAKGVAADRIVLRKPAETGVDGAPEEARRVEIRLVD